MMCQECNSAFLTQWVMVIMKFDSSTRTKFIIMRRIKQFLKSISQKVTDSKTTNSYYYNIVRGDRVYEIRLSDHFTNNEHSDIEIIKINGLYIIKGLGFSIIQEDIIGYLKAFLLLLPYTDKVVEGLQASNKEKTKRLQKLANYELLLEQKDKQIEELSETKRKLTASYNNENNRASCLQNKLTKYQNKFKQIKQICENT